MPARLFVCAGFAAFIATQAPAMLSHGTASPPVSVSLQTAAGAHKRAILSMDRDGHFAGEFRLNGHTVDGVIDTGATFVALGETTARAIGIDTGKLTYDHTVATAAGDVTAARITLDTMMLDGVSLTDVDALVVRNDALSGALVGMSFLGRLSSYGVAGDIMRLER